MKTKTIALAVAAMAAAISVGAVGAAEAGGKHHHHNGFHRGFYFAPAFVGVGVVDSESCGWMWRRYELTGNSYWKRRYFACRY